MNEFLDLTVLTTPSLDQMEPAGVTNNNLSRRRFLEVFGAGAVSLAVLTACGGGEQDSSPSSSAHDGSHPASKAHSNAKPSAASDSSGEAKPSSIGSTSIEVLKASPDLRVQGVGELDALLGNQKVFSGVMQFWDVAPKGFVKGPDGWQRAQLTDSVAAGLKPILIIEPNDDDGNNLDFARPSASDALIKGHAEAFAGYLKHAAIHPSQLGQVVLTPEFIAGGFSDDRTQYAPVLNLFLQRFRAAMPDAPLSNMIDLSEAEALLPHARDVDQRHLHSVGIQAFANGETIPFHNGKPDVSVFISAEKIKQVAKAFGNKPVWINTGIIREEKNTDGGAATYSLKQREAIGIAIADEIAKAARGGVNVTTLNVFAKNKLDGYDADNSWNNKEKRDFSFHPGDKTALRALTERMHVLGINLSAYAYPNDHE